MAHQWSIGSDPEASASALAALVRNDVRTGGVVPLPPDAKFSATAPDESLLPAELAARKVGNCGSFPRAVAPVTGPDPAGNQIGIQRLKNAHTDEVEHHAFVVLGAPGKGPIKTDGTGRAVEPIPTDRLHDECVLRGMNGGEPMPSNFYQGAWLSPVWPPGLENLAHLAVSPAARAAASLAYQGGVRRYVPQTPDGEKVAVVSTVAARGVTPPATYAAPPLAERYSQKAAVEVEAAEKKAVEVVGHATPTMVKQFVAGLEKIALGVHPEGARLAGDPTITAEHAAAAKRLHDLLRILQGGPDIPPEAMALLEKMVAEADGKSAKGDVLKATVSEVHALLPGVVPERVARHLHPKPHERRGGRGDDGDDGMMFAAAAFSSAILFDEPDMDLYGALQAWGVSCCVPGGQGRECGCESRHGGRGRGGHGGRVTLMRPLTLEDPALGAVSSSVGHGGGGGNGGSGGGPLAPTGGGGASSFLTGGPLVGGGGAGPLGGGMFGRSEHEGSWHGRPGWLGGESIGFSGNDVGGSLDGLDLGAYDDDEDGGDDDEDDGSDVVVRRRRVIDIDDPTVVRHHRRSVVDVDDPILRRRRFVPGGIPRGPGYGQAYGQSYGQGYPGGLGYHPGAQGRPGFTGRGGAIGRNGLSASGLGSQRTGTISASGGSSIYAQPNDSGPSLGFLQHGTAVTLLPEKPQQGTGGGSTREWTHVRLPVPIPGTSTSQGWIWTSVIARNPDAPLRGAAEDSIVAERHEGIDDPILAGALSGKLSGGVGGGGSGLGRRRGRHHGGYPQPSYEQPYDTDDSGGDPMFSGPDAGYDMDPTLGSTFLFRPSTCPTGACRR